MKRTLALVCGATLLLSLPHRSPAQVVEKKPSPTEKHKSTDSSGSSSSKGFDGTWRATASWTASAGNTFNQTLTLVIKNGVANVTNELISTLAPGKKWNDIPAPYDSSSPLRTTRATRSIALNPEGSNLKVQWQGSKLTDWAPKAIPIGALKKSFGDTLPSAGLLILTEDHLIFTNGIGTQTYTRVGE
jgi:hypothetical protein